MDSTANITSSGGPPSTSHRPAAGGGPVAHEMPVIATGARENSGKRELFKESTTTALVFPNGGVIRLSAAVAPGQLLFLTNQRNKLEVVAQVTRKRTNPSSGFYIELEFTESTPGFWGIEFPDSPAAVHAANVQQPSTVEFGLLHSAEPAPDDLSPNAPGPTAAEVQALVDEVEALREQLRSMQTQSSATNAETPAQATPPVETPSPIVPPETTNQSQPLEPASTTPPSPPAPPLPAMLAAILNPSAAPQKPTVPSAHHNSSPSGKEQLAQQEDLLPQPDLDFNQAKKPKKNSMMGASNPAYGDRLGILRLALLAAVSLFAILFAAWSLHWLPWSSARTNLPSSASSPVRPAANSTPASRQSSQQKPVVRLEATATPQNPNSSPSEATPSRAPAESGPSADTPTAGPAHKQNPAPVVSVAKRSEVRSTPTAQASPSDETAPILPPKLIKFVRPIAPSDALRSFVTGNVTLDALVDKSGHIESMKVLTGPPSFHKAAMNALKQYRYEPARQNGKPVPAHVTVTVPFWFEP